MKDQWTFPESLKIYRLPLPKLVYLAQVEHTQYFDPTIIQISTLLSIKTGACPENCAYCPQSAHYKTNLPREPLQELPKVLETAKRAKNMGATRFCLGAAWRGPKDKDLKKVCEIITKIKELGLETCATLGLLKNGQAERLKQAGLDYYNHNIDSSPEFYTKIISTRTFEDRLVTLSRVREANIKVCCGGILGMGETHEDRIKMLVILANLNPPPESVPINKLIRVSGTPLEQASELDSFDLVRTIATARIMMSKSYIRLSAGREQMSDELQALCFLAGANSIFYGEKLLTTDNPIPEKDDRLFQRLGLRKAQTNKLDYPP